MRHLIKLAHPEDAGGNHSYNDLQHRKQSSQVVKRNAAVSDRQARQLADKKLA